MSTQALSLKCNVCGVQLRSVAEAQSHGEATGHADFVESTEAVLNLQCVECGKPCRSETEKDIHTKRTGHATFVDKTNETAAAIDSEREMKKLDSDMKAELGIEVKKSKTETTDDAMDVDSEDPNEEKIAPEVDAKCLAELEGMGFNVNRATRALYHTGTDNVEQAVNWIVEHENDADIDTPLLIAKSKIKVKLTKEEARVKAEELRKSMAAKKEKEEREMERLREQERIRSGKELLVAKRQEEELQLKRNIEARRIEKEEVARAKARIKEKLEEDRIARRLKLGLPAELTEEERAKEREREEKKAAAAAEAAKKKAEAGLVVKPVEKIDALRKILVDIKKTHGESNNDGVTTCFKTLLLYLGNVMKDPEQEKFRKIKLDNAAFLKRVAGVGGGAFLEKCGFVNDGESLTLPRDQVDKLLFNLAGGEINGALNNPFFGVL